VTAVGIPDKALDNSPAAPPPSSERQLAVMDVAVMEADRDEMIPWWRDCANFFAPRAQRLDPSGNTRGNVLNRHVINEAAIYARRTLASSMSWGLTNASRPWAAIQAKDPRHRENGAVQEYCATATERFFEVLAGSNFYKAQGGAYRDLCGFGTAAYLIEEDERDVVRFTPWAVGSYAIADDHRGEVGAASRVFTMTLRKIVQRFGRDPITGEIDSSRFSTRLKDALKEKRWGDRFEIQHLIDENPDHDPSRDAPEAWPVRSRYWEKGATPENEAYSFLAEEGYREWPLPVYRWERIADEVWASNWPAAEALGSNKSLQKMESKGLRLLDKLVDPPIVGPMALKGKGSLLPGAYNAIDDRDKQARALHEVRAEGLQHLEVQKEKTVERIYDLFYTRLMQYFTSQAGSADKTIPEVEAISQEKFLVFGDVLESCNETLSLVVDRVFGIMERRGLLPEPPEEIAGTSLAVEYTSIFSVALKSAGLGNLERFIQIVANLSQTTEDPRVLMKVDMAQVVDELHARSGVPPRILRSDEEVAELEATAAEAQDEERRVALAEQEANAAARLANAPLGGGTALDKVMQGMQGAAT
jgi:hypothetical protein